MLIATTHEVYELNGEGEPSLKSNEAPVRRVAEGRNYDVVAVGTGTLLIFHDDQYRAVSTGIEDPVHSLLILDEEAPVILIGTEPPHLYRLTGLNGPAERNESFAGLEVRDTWRTPWGGPPALRSLAAAGGGWVYADIHVGSIMRSGDGGATWEPVTPELHEDVHQVNTCPASGERVYAETARAFYLSEDHGDSWLHRADDLGARYGRAVTVHPQDPDLVLATVSDGPHGENVHGQLYRSEDGGLNWEHVADGFPASTPDNINTFHVAFDTEGAAWACVDRTLYVGRDGATRWETVWEAPDEILMLSCRTP